MSLKSKPIKRSPALVEFSRDHHFGLLLVWKIRQGQRTGIPPVRISNYVQYFYQHDLCHHFADEEAYLFPILALNNPDRIRAEREHAEIRSLVRSLKEDPFDKSWLSLLTDLLESHIRFEERELFNQLQASLGHDELLSLLHNVPARPHIKEGAWEDEFWVRKAPNTEKSHAG